MRRIFLISLLPQLVSLQRLDGKTNEDNSRKFTPIFEESKLRIVENDILISDRSDEYKGSALKDESAKWPDARVAVVFSNSFSEREQLKIIDAMKEIHNKTCVRFYNAMDGDDDCLMIVKPGNRECSSMVGRRGGHQPLRLSSGCFTKKIILHELMHALGFIHEHNRSDRDEYVTIKWENIKEDESHNFKKRNFDDLALMGTEYAYESIMHYEGNEFPYDPLLPTIVSKKKGIKMGGEEHLSEIDVFRINKYYQCETSTTMAPVTTSTEAPVTTSTEAPAELLPTTVAPSTIEPQRRIHGCTNAYGMPSENGECRWLIMRAVKDATSDRHYLFCVPNSLNKDIRCGKWVRKECSKGSKFDKVLQMCRRPPFFW